MADKKSTTANNAISGLGAKPVFLNPGTTFSAKSATSKKDKSKNQAEPVHDPELAAHASSSSSSSSSVFIAEKAAKVVSQTATTIGLTNDSESVRKTSVASDIDEAVNSDNDSASTTDSQHENDEEDIQLEEKVQETIKELSFKKQSSNSEGPDSIDTIFNKHRASKNTRRSKGDRDHNNNKLLTSDLHLPPTSTIDIPANQFLPATTCPLHHVNFDSDGLVSHYYNEFTRRIFILPNPMPLSVLSLYKAFDKASSELQAQEKQVVELEHPDDIVDSDVQRLRAHDARTSDLRDRFELATFRLGRELSDQNVASSDSEDEIEKKNDVNDDHRVHLGAVTNVEVEQANPGKSVSSGNNTSNINMNSNSHFSIGADLTIMTLPMSYDKVEQLEQLLLQRKAHNTFIELHTMLSKQVKDSVITFAPIMAKRTVTMSQLITYPNEELITLLKLIYRREEYSDSTSVVKILAENFPMEYEPSNINSLNAMLARLTDIRENYTHQIEAIGSTTAGQKKLILAILDSMWKSSATNPRGLGYADERKYIRNQVTVQTLHR